MLFWSHKVLGKRLQVSAAEEFGKLADSHTLVPDRFEAYQLVPFKENRLVVFDATLFHSKQTYSNRGDKDNCRVIEVGFFAEEKFDIPEVR